MKSADPKRMQRPALWIGGDGGGRLGGGGGGGSSGRGGGSGGDISGGVLGGGYGTRADDRLAPQMQ